jgi:catechol 2,3-dioxygenase-like lactoylglutathione lyase family enzyme
MRAIAKAIAMLDHVTVSVEDFKRSRVFYDGALTPLGIKRLYADGDSAAGYGQNGKALFWIAQQNCRTTQVHIAFVAPDRDAIVEFYVAALASGGRDNGAPGLRPQYHERYFAAFVLDPDGNNVEAVLQL